MTQYILVLIPRQLSCQFNLNIVSGLASTVFTLHPLPKATLLCPSLPLPPPPSLSLSLSSSLPLYHLFSTCLDLFISPHSLFPFLSLLSRTHRASLRNLRLRWRVHQVQHSAVDCACMNDCYEFSSSTARPASTLQLCSVMTWCKVRGCKEKLAPVYCGFDLG